MMVNGQVYRVCPRSLTFPHTTSQHLAGVFFDCKENKAWPFPGGPTNQTAYCKEVFDYLDSIVTKFRENQHEKDMAAMKKNK